ncbi:MAG: metallophosphoesterase family protein [Bacillota bacterium]
MRIALFGDIHSNYHALEAVLTDLHRRGADRLICLGDITMKGPLPKECVERVRNLGCPVVLGNTDRCYHPDHHPALYPVHNESQAAALRDFDRHLAALSGQDRQWLTSFPLTHSEVVEGLRMDFFHAVPHHNYVLVMPWASNEELEVMRLSEETVLSGCGHNHRPYIRSYRGRVVVNAGSVGIPFDGDPRPSYALIEVSNGGLSTQLIRVPYDVEAAIRAAQQAGMAGWELFAHTARTGQFAG